MNPAIRRTYVEQDETPLEPAHLVHVVRYGRRWMIVRERCGQYRTDTWYSAATEAGLRYVVSGGGNTSYRTLRAALSALDAPAVRP